MSEIIYRIYIKLVLDKPGYVMALQTKYAVFVWINIGDYKAKGIKI